MLRLGHDLADVGEGRWAGRRVGIGRRVIQGDWQD